MVPCANLIGFAGQELARKLPKVFGVLLETTLGSIVEMVLFIVLLTRLDHEVDIKALKRTNIYSPETNLLSSRQQFWGLS